MLRSTQVRRGLTATGIAALMLAATGVAIPATSHAAPSIPCSTQIERAADVSRRIDKHNAEPNVFSQQSQVDAYNARARSLNQEKSVVRDALNKCTSAMRLLRGTQDIEAPTDKQFSAIEKAAAKIPSGYKAPSDSSKSGGTVSVPSELQALYEALSIDSPGKIGDDESLNGASRPKIGDADEAFPASSGRKIEEASNGGALVTPAHIVPIARLVSLEGFTQLSAESMYYVANAPINLQWLSFAASQAKSSSSAAAVLGVDQKWLDAQDDKAESIESQLVTYIASLVQSEQALK